MPKKFSSEELHQQGSDAAYRLSLDREKKERLDKSNFVNRLIAAISGERKKIEAAIEQSENTYEKNLQLAQEHIDQIHEEANEYVRTYKIYQEELQNLAQELKSQYAERVASVPWPGSPVDISDYIDELQKLEIGENTSPDDKARILAAVDIVKPKINNPDYSGMTFKIGESIDGDEIVAIRNGSRFPRWEIGRDNMKSATDIAEKKQWEHILEVSTSVTSSDNEGPDESPYTIAKKDVFIPISKNMTELLEQAGADNLNSSSSLHVNIGEEKGQYYGDLNERFRIIDLKEVKTAK